MSKKKTTQEFIQDIRTKRPELDFLDFSESEYDGNKTPIKIYCKKHDEWFWEEPDKLLSTGCVSCPKCMEETRKEGASKNFENGKRRFCREEKYGKTRSGGENMVFQWFEKNNLLEGLNEQVHVNNTDLKYQNINKDYILVDFVYTSKEGKVFWIEYNGKQHYKEDNTYHPARESYEKQVIRDWCEEEHCKASGITLIAIPFNRADVKKVWEVLDDVILNDGDPLFWCSRPVQDREEILKKNNLI